MMNEVPPTVHIIADGFPEAYYKAIRACLRGATKWRDYGGPILTKDIISLIEIKNPLEYPISKMMHPDFPTKESHLLEYLRQFERDYDWKKQGFEYSYVDRLINYPTTEIDSRNDGYFKVQGRPGTRSIDQIMALRDKIAARIKKGEECLVSNRYFVVTWVPERDLFVKEDQPCLQSIQIFIYSFPSDKNGDTGSMTPGKGEFVLHWRSRDLYTAWNSNMVALLLFLKKEIFDPNNIEIIRCIDFCGSLHIYEGDLDAASKVRPVLKSPQVQMKY